MGIISTRLTAALAGVAMLASLGSVAYAQNVGAGVSVGGENGVNGGAGVSIGGGDGTNGGAGVSIGGENGVNGGAGASIGGSNGTNGGAGASIGGQNGANGGAGASIGGSNGANGGAGVSLGGANGVNLGVGFGTVDGSNTPGTGVAGAPTGTRGKVGTSASNSTSSKASRSLAGLSAKEIARYKVRCAAVLSNSSSFDGDLVALCRAVKGM